MNYVLPIQPDDPGESVSTAELSAFHGETSCPREWEAYRDGKSTLAGFNVWAALFGAQWFLCKRLYWQALIAFSLEAGIPMFLGLASGAMPGAERYREHDIAVPFVIALSILLVKIAIGYWANIALYKKAVKEIHRIDALNLDNKLHLKMIAHAGRMNIGALTALYIGIVALRILLGRIG